MSHANLEIDGDLAKLLIQLDRPLHETAQEFMTLELYRRGMISSGKAAEILHMSRWSFIQHASRLGISFFNRTDDEWAGELAESGVLPPIDGEPDKP